MKRISSTQNPLIKELVRLRTDSKERSSKGSVLLFGDAIVREQKIRPKRLFSIREEDNPDYLLSQELLVKISGMPGYEGVIGEFEMPKPQLTQGPRLLVLDQVRDPGNMGTLLRTALAIGWDGAFLLPGCVDPFNDKALRAGRGAQLKLPLYEGTVDELMKEKRRLYIADMGGSEAYPIESPCGLILSNESQGASKSKFVDVTTVTVPMKGDMESLNVAIAGAIIMYKMQEAL